MTPWISGLFALVSASVGDAANLLTTITITVGKNSGFSWAQIVTPGATFISAVLGVVLGGYITRRNMFDVEDRRAIVEDAANMRRTQGTARALRSDLEQARIKIDTSMKQGSWWPAAVTVSISLGREEQVLMATWFRPGGWDLVAIALHTLVQEDAARSHRPSGTPNADPASFEFTISAVTDAIDVINKEIDALDAAIRDAGPDRRKAK